MKTFVLTRVILAILIIIAAQSDTKKALGQSPLGSQSERKVLAPILGNYPNTSLPLSTDTTITPDAAPTNTTSINISTSTNFKGKLEGYPATGVVRVTDAHPAGTYAVTVRAFDSAGASATKTFTLTVTTPATCNPVTFASAPNIPIGNIAGAVAVGDFNGDGIQDLAVTNGNSNTVSILTGNGSGNFNAVTTLSGVGSYSIVVGDFNGDGNQDLAAVTGSNQVSILLGDGAGHFAFPTFFATENSSLTGVAVGDFNGDGKQDLVTSNYNSSDVSVLLGDGAGHFSAPTNYDAGILPRSVAVGDFNSDGKQDLAVANADSKNVSVLLGDGAGHFNPPTNYGTGDYPRSVAVGDFNGDGKQDLAVANSESNNVSILLGDGAGNFSAPTNFPVGSYPYLVVMGDFNGDGKQDLAVANAQSDNVSILLGDGAGNFAAATNFAVSGSGPGSAAVGDFNGDSRQDLAVANLGSHDVSILLRTCVALIPTSAVSRKTHGSAGTFDINLPLTGPPAIECRSGGPTNDFTIVATFSENVAVNGNPQAQVTSGIGTIGSGGMSNGGMVAVTGNVVTIPLTNVANAQTINVTLFGVNSSGNVILPMRLLTGDMNANGVVNGTDVVIAKSRIGQPIDSSNFKTDVNANGVINATDVSNVKSHVGTGLP